MGNHVPVRQAISLEDRAFTAREFAKETGLTIPVYIDCFADDFMKAFSAHPQRYFVIDGQGSLALKASPFEGEYDLGDVDRVLTQLCID
jgi:hypothetical protein